MLREQYGEYAYWYSGVKVKLLNKIKKKSELWTADKEVNRKAIFAVINTTWAVVKIRHDLCDTGAVLYQLSWQANWELVIMLVPNKPEKWWKNYCESPFHSQEWPVSNFSLQYLYIVKKTGDENQEKIN